jgi:hypothetical protein
MGGRSASRARSSRRRRGVSRDGGGEVGALANLRAPLLGLVESPSGKCGRMPTAALSPEPKFRLERCARARARPGAAHVR